MAVALHSCSSVLRGGLRTSEQSLSSGGSQVQSSVALRFLKINLRAPGRIYGGRKCSWRARVGAAEKTQQGVTTSATATAEAAVAAAGPEAPTYGRQFFPLAAVVGQDAMKTALLLGAVDGAVGAIALSRKRGTAKTIMARGLHALLPPIEVVKGSVANADVKCPAEWEGGLAEKLQYDNDGNVAVEVIRAPFVQIPLGITEDRLLGSVNVEESIKTGTTVFQPGLLAHAHRGVLYVDEINLLDEGISNLLLNVLVGGENVVEREGVSFRHPCKPLLIATYNPDEGAVRKHLLDRIAINLSADNAMNFDERVNAVEIATQFQENSKQVQLDVYEATDTVKTQVILGREWLKDATISKEQIEYLVMEAIRGTCQEDVKEEDKLKEQQKQQAFVGKGHQRSKRFAISQGRRVQTLGGYTSMIIMYTRTGRYKEAEKMIEEMDFHGVVPDEANWLARLSAYGQQGKIREAEKVFRGLQESGISADNAAFNSMILFYGRARMYDRAYTTLRKMVEIGGNPGESTYRSMIGACGRAGKLKDALLLLAEMRELNFRPTVQNYNTLITLYGKTRSASGILRTIQDMKDIGCKPDGHTVDASLRAMDRAGKLVKTLDTLLRHLRDAGWYANAASYGPLLNAYLKCRRVKEALETFRLMRKENLIPKEGLFRELISQCKDVGKLAETEYVFSEFEAVGITPSIETACSMINALGLMEKVQEAERLYNRLGSSGVKLDIVVYNVMINVYMRVGSHQDAARIFETIEQHPDVCPDSYTYHGMLRVYHKAGLSQEAVEVYWRIVHSGIELDEGMLNCIINCCGRVLPLDETSRLFQAMLDAGFSPNVITFNLIIDIYGKAGLFARAYEVFNIAKEHGKIDNITYSTLINFFGKQRDFVNMEATAWEMKTMNLGFWVEAYNSMLDAYGKAGLLSQMENVLERIHKAGCPGDIFTSNILINTYGKKGLMEDLESVLGQMEEQGMKPDSWTYNTLIGTYGQAEVPDKVMSIFKEMQEVGLMPDRVTYKNLVAAFEKSGNLWEAARWSVWMTQTDHAVDTPSSHARQPQVITWRGSHETKRVDDRMR